MIAFWISAALLLVLALALVLPALLKSKNSVHKTAYSAALANLSVLRSQLTQLDADFATGSINADQLALAKSDIERRALEEESVPVRTESAGALRTATWDTKVREALVKALSEDGEAVRSGAAAGLEEWVVMSKDPDRIPLL